MAEKQPGAETRSAAGMPLFFRDPHPLSHERHRSAGLNPVSGYAFARRTNSVPLAAAEFFEAARNYPIVFTAHATPLPLALVGIQEENCFLDAQGQWRDYAYIPAYVRRYPFIFMEDSASDRLILCVDEAAPHFTAARAKAPFYDAQGNPAEVTKNALEFCTLFQQHHHQTVEFCTALAEHKLLVERVSTVKMRGGAQVNLSGFQMLDAEKFAELPDQVFLEWRRKGWVALADAVLLSYTNWNSLAFLARKQAA